MDYSKLVKEDAKVESGVIETTASDVNKSSELSNESNKRRIAIVGHGGTGAITRKMLMEALTGASSSEVPITLDTETNLHSKLNMLNCSGDSALKRNMQFIEDGSAVGLKRLALESNLNAIDMIEMAPLRDKGIPIVYAEEDAKLTPEMIKLLDTVIEPDYSYGTFAPLPESKQYKLNRQERRQRERNLANEAKRRGRRNYGK